MTTAVILNRDKGDRGQLAAALSAAGIDASVDAVDGKEIEGRVHAALKEGATRVIVGGGDGSVSAAAQALAGTDTALGILPTGTLNHFARDLGLPLEPSEAATVIATGRSRSIDIAEVNGRVFVNNSAIGLYPQMVVDREAQQQRLGRSKRLAMAVASLRTLARFHRQRLTLSVDGGERRVDTPLLFVGNNDYRLAMPDAGKRERLDQGRLCVLVMRKKGVPGFLAAVARALLGLTCDNDLVRLDGVKRLVVDSDCQQLILAVDGETIRLAPPLDFRIRESALTVVTP